MLLSCTSFLFFPLYSFTPKRIVRGYVIIYFATSTNKQTIIFLQSSLGYDVGCGMVCDVSLPKYAWVGILFHFSQVGIYIYIYICSSCTFAVVGCHPIGGLGTLSARAWPWHRQDHVDDVSCFAMLLALCFKGIHTSAICAAK
jgi:hypothetical protein